MVPIRRLTDLARGLKLHVFGRLQSRQANQLFGRLRYVYPSANGGACRRSL
jgi:hypothetical protein